MKEMKQNRKTKYTQTALKNSLIELMQEKSISKITIKELCENADINRTTFYAHYSDQYELLRCIEEETFTWGKEIIAKFTEKTDKTEMIKNIEKAFEYFADNKSHIQTLMSEKGDIDFQKKLMTIIYEQCGMSLADFVDSTKINTELYFVFIVNGSIGLIQHWLKNGLKESPAEMAEIIYNMAANINNL